MHHLIQQMGWKIVCKESKDLGRRSRLWDCADVLYVLKNNIVSVLLYRHKFREVYISTIHASFVVSCLTLILLLLVTREQIELKAWC